jgi:threonine/homoserine/homoserine lactone efflux protein
LIASGEARDLLFVVGGVFMLYIAYSTLRRAKVKPASGPVRGGRFPYLLGLTIGLTNPFQLAWWIAVGVGMISTFGLNIVAGFFAGIIAWTLFLSTILRAGLTRYQRIYPVLVYASGAILVLFGVWFLYSAISSLV